MTRNDNLVSALTVLFRNRKKLAYTILSAVAITALVSFIFLDNYYKSKTTFLVASTDIFKPEQVFGSSTKDIEYTGTENDVDRILTIADSPELYDYLIQKFSLYKHYKIDSTKVKAPFKVRETLQKLYDVKKTTHNAIELTVEDVSNKQAAEMTLAARNKVDEIAQRLIRNTQAGMVKTFENSMAEKTNNIMRLGDSLQKLRQKFGIIDPDKEIETITGNASQAESNFIRNEAKYKSAKDDENVKRDTLALLKATAAGYEKEAILTKSKLERYNEGYNAISQTKEALDYERLQKNRDNQKYMQLNSAYRTNTSAIIITEEPRVEVEKSRPKRSLIILTAALIATLFSIIGVLLFDNYKDIDWKDIVQENENGESGKSDKPKGIGFKHS